MLPKQIMNKAKLKSRLNELKFVNSAFNSLPIDSSLENKPREVVGYNYSQVTPTATKNPKTLSLSREALELLDLDKDGLLEDSDTPYYLSGNKILPDSKPIAHNYCGHQFGVFAGQLGDGRAITLGDIKNERGELWELQLKGAGQTPYSRFADGKAVLRSSIREYLCSEAMWALRIPTTRAASLIVTETLAERDPLYTGDRIYEKCAIVMRLAPTFWRFGTFEIFKPLEMTSGRKGPSFGLEKELLPKMLNYLLENHYNEIYRDQSLSKFEEKCLEMYKKIVNLTAELVALWQAYGFCHGVLNTDNMSVLGLTIDYGPFGWMDYFNYDHICNHSDESGRYSYRNQPEICKWNLFKLAEALKPAVDFTKMKSYLYKEYDEIYKKAYYDKMRARLGLFTVECQSDIKLIDSLLDLMHEFASDFTLVFRNLNLVDIPDDLENLELKKEIIDTFVGFSPGKEIIAKKFKPRYSKAQIEKIKLMAQSNPKLLYMMGLDPEILEIEERKLEKITSFLEKTDEEIKLDAQIKWKIWLEDYSRRLVLEKLSIRGINEKFNEFEGEETTIRRNYDNISSLKSDRIDEMNKVNPIYILRNYMAEEAIERAEKGDFSKVEELLHLILNPFTQQETKEEISKYEKCPPNWASDICVSCSS